MATTIHPTAIVDKGAELGEGVVIGPYSIVGSRVKLADRVVLHSHVVVQGITDIGEDSELFPFSCIGTAPQDLKFHGEESILSIGKRNKIRESVTIQPGTEHGTMKTTVGDDNLFMANSHVGHDCRLGSHLVLANSVALAGHVTVEDGVILGGMAGIHQFTRIGELAFIGAGAMVSLDVPPYCIAQGDRAVIRGLNLIGLRRNGFTASDVSEVKKTFRFLFSRTDDGENYKDRILKISQDTLQNLKIKKFIDFISQTKRGITIPNRLEVRKQENSTDNEAE